jgi:hypothetical protein
VTRDLCGFQGEKGWIALNAPEFVDWSASEEKGRFRQRRPDQPVVTLPTTASRSTGCDASDYGVQINRLWRFRPRHPDQLVVTLPTTASRSTGCDSSDRGVQINRQRSTFEAFFAVTYLLFWVPIPLFLFFSTHAMQTYQVN